MSPSSATLPIVESLDCGLQLNHDLVYMHLEPYPIHLRTTFGTSHSSSTCRQNALLTITIHGLICGYGEVGLPLKKTGCYEASFSSLREQLTAFQLFTRQLQLQSAEAQSYDPFADVPECYFQPLRRELSDSLKLVNSTSTLIPTLRQLFYALDTYLSKKRPEPTDAAFVCLFEVTLFDLWSRARKRFVCELVGMKFDASIESTSSTSPTAAASSSSTPDELPRPPCQPRSFYTIGMDSIETMLSNLDFGLRYTPLIKIKVDSHADTTRQVLDAIVTRVKSVVKDGEFHISVDANAAWSTPETAMAFLDVLKPYREYISMVEQPFPLFRACPAYIDPDRPESRMEVIDGEYVDLSDSTFHGWRDVAEAYASAGFLIYADESICSPKDLQVLRPILHGINIKLEKAGGYRGALKLLHAARASGVHIWLGCMVGSSLNSTQAAQLLPFAADDRWGDLDGALLTKKESDRFQGGMEWTEAKDGETHGTGEIQMKQLPCVVPGMMQSTLEDFELQKSEPSDRSPPISSFARPSPSTHSMATPPATRLIGVELNPGPIVQDSVLSTHSITSPQPTAQTLFVDGVLSIFTWLHLPHLLAACRSCHYWYSCGLKAKSRELEFNLMLRPSPSGEYVMPNLASLLSSPFRFHIIDISRMKLLDLLAIQSDVAQLNHLKKLELIYDTDVESPSCPTLALPTSLTELRLRFDSDIFAESTVSKKAYQQEVYQSLIDAVSRCCSHVTRCQFSNHSHLDLSVLTALSGLRHLVLMPWMGFPPGDQQICAQLPLISLDFRGAYQIDWSIFHPLTPLMQMIEEIDWVRWQPSESDWEHLIAHPPPHLTSLVLNLTNFSMNPPCWSGLPRLANLQRLCILNYYRECDIQLDGTGPVLDISILAQCHSLTCLRIDSSIFTKDQFDLLLAASPLLNHTSKDGCLTVLEYKSATTIVTETIPPPKPLVNAELNPGPFQNSIQSSPSMTSPPPTAQTLFVDGVLSIFTWLSLSDVTSAWRSCHYWYACGLKEKSRDLTFDFALRPTPAPDGQVLDEYSSLPLHLSSLMNSPFQYHVTTFSNMTLLHLYTIQSHIPKLNHIKKFDLMLDTYNGDVSANLDLPTSLTQLQIMFNRYAFPSLIDAITRCCSRVTHCEFHNFTQQDLDLLLPRLPGIRHLALLRWGFTREHQQSCAQLPLISLKIRGSFFGPDWTVFHPLMQTIEEIDWGYFYPSESDWLHLTAHPPPHLHSLTLHLTTFNCLVGLPHLSNLRRLYIDALQREDVQLDDDHIKLLGQCHSLIYLQIQCLLLTQEQFSRLLNALPHLIPLSDSPASITNDGFTSLYHQLSTVTVADVAPPAKRLVGIELNPGPFFKCLYCCRLYDVGGCLLPSALLFQHCCSVRCFNEQLNREIVKQSKLQSGQSTPSLQTPSSGPTLSSTQSTTRPLMDLILVTLTTTPPVTPTSLNPQTTEERPTLHTTRPFVPGGHCGTCGYYNAAAATRCQHPPVAPVPVPMREG